MAPLDGGVLQHVVIALALGALVGIERERVPERKYAGIRTLSILCAAGPLSVLVGEATGSVAPVVVYLLLVAAIALSIVYIRFEVQEADLGFTTSASVFLLGLVGVLVGFGRYFPAVATTLFAVFLLSEKRTLQRYAAHFESDDLSDAAVVGILALVVYPILPEGAVGPYGVLFLRKALLFVITILLVQFAAFLSLQWLKMRVSLLAAAAIGGVVSSLAVVTTMVEYVRTNRIGGAAASAALTGTVTMVLRNGALAVALSPGLSLLRPLAAPFLVAAGVGTAAAAVLYGRTNPIDDVDFDTESPFSFAVAFQFGALFLGVLVLSEVATVHLSILGAYGTAFVGGFASSTAVVASAVTLLSAGSVTEGQAAVIVAIGTVASLLAKLLYAEAGGARSLAARLLGPYALMSLAVLAVAV